MNIVIGSGPAGVACARALAKMGEPVTILDSGLTLESEREALRARLAETPIEDWSKDVLQTLSGPETRPGELPQKLSFGSDYPYRRAEGAWETAYGGLAVRASHAAGGLSNVWGGAILPYRQADVADWPVSAAELARAYAEVLRFLPIAAVHDELASEFPLYAEPGAALPYSRQAARVHERLVGSRSELARRGVVFGAARLAVAPTDELGQGGCIRCGRCLHGCPRGLIYSARQTLEDILRTHPSVRYVTGLVVREVLEHGGGVRVVAASSTGAIRVFEAARAFIGAGALNTTAIVLRSLGLYDSPRKLLDSQYFLFPALQFASPGPVRDERLHTLAQLFIECFDSAISPHAVHLQLYTYSDHLRNVVASRLGRLGALAPKEQLLDRLLLFQGYLHSAHSGALGVRLSRRGAEDVLQVEATPAAAAAGVVRQVVRKVRGLARFTGALPISPLVEVTEPGRGFHIGGSFPMSRTPTAGESDRLGRPFGLQRTHLIDSSIFPSVPATTITLTVMANAHRIAREALALEDAAAA